MMFKSIVGATFSATLLLATGIATFSPDSAQAQGTIGESQGEFTRRMTQKLDNIRKRTSRVEKALEANVVPPEEKLSRNERKRLGWIESELVEIEKQTRTEERRMRFRHSANPASSQMQYMDRNKTENAVYQLDQRIKSLEKYVRSKKSED
jgi:hypothetical protein